MASQKIISHSVTPQKSKGVNINNSDLKNLDVDNTLNRGQIFDIQSIYFSGTGIYNILESEGALPKNIHKYISYKNLLSAVRKEC